MTIDDLITAQMNIARMNVERGALVSAAAQGLPDGVIGYKATIARAKLRDAATALAEHDQKSDSLKEKLDQDHPNTWFAERYALYMLERDALEAVVTTAEERLRTTLEESKKSAWKWAGRKDNAEPPMVVTARSAIVTAKGSVALLDKNNADIKKFIDRQREWEKEEAEMQAWFAGGAMPASVRRKHEAEKEAFLNECVTLKRGPCVVDEVVDEEEEDNREWLNMTVDEYFLSLMPKVVVETVVQFRPSTRGVVPAWIKRITAARAARAIPRLIVTDV